MFRSINGGKLPQRATKYSAGFDVFANEDITINAGETVAIALGIALEDEWFQLCPEPSEFMQSHYFDLCIRSSMALKGLIIPNGAGKIDMDYRDEIKILIHNPIQMDTVDLAIRVFQVALDASLRKYSEQKVQNEMLAFIEERKDQLGVVRIKKGEKIGQLILCRHEGYLLPAEYTLDAERTGGFGSTDAVY